MPHLTFFLPSFQWKNGSFPDHLFYNLHSHTRTVSAQCHRRRADRKHLLSFLPPHDQSQTLNISDRFHRFLMPRRHQIFCPSSFCRRLKVISPVTLSDHVRQVCRWQSGSSADFAGRNSYSHNQMMFSGSVRRTSGRLHLLISLPHSLKNQIRLFFCHPLLFSKAMPPKTSFYFLR